MDYDRITLSASNKGLMMVDKHFSNFLQKILPGLIETLLNSILEEGSFETVKIKPFLRKFSKTLYKNFDILDDAKLKFEFLKNEEGKFISVFNLNSSLHKKDSKKKKADHRIKVTKKGELFLIGLINLTKLI